MFLFVHCAFGVIAKKSSHTQALISPELDPEKLPLRSVDLVLALHPSWDAPHGVSLGQGPSDASARFSLGPLSVLFLILAPPSQVPTCLWC